ncbi:4'-phosphopantetheinyl transferase family protein [Streptomyces rhizosphaerihabitans]|uniref:4'-phosphopantetheinyl transferase family protein n=1 Tax=Streptomyces rhizosphaerihabitans TaxID=1266770 RepID=UPI0021BFED1B|nr:4'-phosphopantetheinyl transferase superfamily protein [Streptomyces rhizosphaerihabitans]MCT9009547.1 4'-phosphopantetheinyl transferase superfamily protein [Streptomyces rhizosphaerihabitans]
MMEELLPESVVVVESHGDDEAEGATLYPEELAVLTRAVGKRRREFTTVRVCARRAMEKLGVAPGPVLPGERGAPQWPEGVIGSMTHCEGYGAAALARATDLASLGIDAEPHLALPEDVLDAVALPGESGRLDRLGARAPAVHWDRLLFSAKESVYKAWFPLTGKWLDFSGADIDISLDEASATGSLSGSLRAQLLVPGPVVDGASVQAFDGRWTVQGGLVATAVTVPRAHSGPASGSGG